MMRAVSRIGTALALIVLRTINAGGIMGKALTLEDVVKAVQDASASERETVETLRHLIASRRLAYASRVSPYGPRAQAA
jgi:hypothetical protein